MSVLYVNEPGATISQSEGKFIVTRKNDAISEIPMKTLEKLVVIDGVNITPKVIRSLLYMKIPVFWISSHGKFRGRLDALCHSGVFKQEQQILMRNTDFSMSLAKKVIGAKIHNQKVVLRRYDRDRKFPEVKNAIASIEAQEHKVSSVETVDVLMGYEGVIARTYFATLGVIVPKGFEFQRRSKRPPLDAFNAMLSFGYSLLFQEIYSAIRIEGLHPYFGFMHSLKENHPALASDLMEEWRPVVVDSFVMSLVNHHEILPEHFQTNEGEGILLTSGGREIFLNAYERKMRTELKHRHSYRNMIHVQVSNYAKALMSHDETIYEPIWLR